MSKIPLGTWVLDSVEYLLDKFSQPLGAFSDQLEEILQFLITLLIGLPPIPSIIILALILGILKKSLKTALLFSLGPGLIYNLGHWNAMLETLVMVGLSTLICILTGIPLGILCARRPLIYKVLRPLLDFMQTIPTFVYLIPTLMFFGLGMVPGIISTVIFALPAPIRLTYLGISSVPKQMVEVSISFGANPWQLLRKTEIPAAAPMILTGIEQCVMLSLSMVVIAALVGADGLGRPVVSALNTVNLVKGFEAGLSIVILAILFERLLKPNNPAKNFSSKGKKQMTSPNQARPSPLIQLSNVKVDFENPKSKQPFPFLKRKKASPYTALKSINLSIQEGDFYVLMGPSGCGKSTLLRLVNGLLLPTEGKVLVEFRKQQLNLSTISPETLRLIRTQLISMVFQHFGLFPWKTVGENVGYPLELQKIPQALKKEKIEQALSQVRLQEWIHKYPAQLSGGMQQRVGLARALVTDAPILLMDEPFSALDPVIRPELQDELLELQKRLKKTILFVSHDFDEAMKLASRVGLIKNGRILQEGTPEEIVQSQSLPTLQVDHIPVSLENSQGNFLGVLGGNTLFKQLMKKN